MALDNGRGGGSNHMLLVGLGCCHIRHWLYNGKQCYKEFKFASTA